MNRRLPALVFIVTVVVVTGVVIARRASLGGSHQHQPGATYYCPMHPTYTSDRPGDCPICNMRLVSKPKASEETLIPAAPGSASSMAETICYRHQCDKLHQGKPCPMTIIAKPGEVVRCPVCGNYVAGPEGQLKKVLYWTDPMIPGLKADQPGQSPMGMDLVPVFQEAQPATETAAAPEGYAPVLLTPQKQQLIGVTTAPVTQRAITKTIRTVGRIAYDPALYQTQAEFLQSLEALRRAEAAQNPAGVEQAQRLAESSRMKLRLQGLSEGLLEDIAQRGAPDKSLLLPGAEGQVWLYAPVYEYELPFVRIGQMVQAESPTQPGTTYEGRVRAIDAVLDPATRSARVRAVLTAPEGRLRPEMFVNASIQVDLGEVLAVPEEAVFHTGTAQIVFIDKGQGLFEPRHVTLGLKAEGWYEVREGLTEGEVAVTSGNFLIDSESRLKAALQSAAGSSGHQHGP